MVNDVIEFKKNFEKNFGKWKNKTVALYGLGNSTKDILENIKGYSFIVVADVDIGEFFFGKKIYSIQEAVKNCSIVIVVALPKSVNIIYDRINGYCDNVKILNLAGKILNKEDDSYNVKEYINQYAFSKEDKLLAEILSKYMKFDENGKIFMDSFEDLGKIVFSAIFILCLEYLNKIFLEDNAFIVFSSRDCYLFSKVYKTLFGEDFNNCIYLYTSRRALTVPNISDEADIRNILEDIGRFSRGRYDLLVSERLGTDVRDVFENEHTTNKNITENIKKNIILRDKEKIIKNAKLEKENYKKYLQGYDLKKHKNLYFVDLVTSGTNYRAFMKLIDRECNLVCLGYKNSTEKSNRKIFSILGNIDIFSSLNTAKYYQLLEIAFSSTEPQVKCFDTTGKKIFERNTMYNGEAIILMQKGILKIVKEYFDSDENHNKLWNT